MGRMGSLVRHNDIAGWGVAALVSGAFAVFTANAAGFIPDHLLSGLHATRLQGGSFNQIRTQVVEVQADATRITRDYRTLLARFNLLDDDRGEMVRRLAAVERSLPLLIESLPLDSDIDRSLLTASIAAASPEVYESDGVMISVRHSPLFDDVLEAPASQPLPPLAVDHPAPPAEPDAALSALDMQGVAIGPLVASDAAPALWDEIMGQVGPLLLGTMPLLAETDDPAQTHIVAGPLPDLASADLLCSRLLRAGISCDPVRYDGQPFP